MIFNKISYFSCLSLFPNVSKISPEKYEREREQIGYDTKENTHTEFPLVADKILFLMCGFEKNRFNWE